MGLKWFYDGEEITSKVRTVKYIGGLGEPAVAEIKIRYTLRERLADKLWGIRYRIAHAIYPTDYP